MAERQLNSILKTAAASVAVFALWGCKTRPRDGFFDAGQGGDPVWFQDFFWFFGHPEIHLPILALVLLYTGLFVRARFPKVWRGLKSIPRKATTIPGLWVLSLIFIYLWDLGRQLYLSTSFAQVRYRDTYYIVTDWYYKTYLTLIFTLVAIIFWILPRILKCTYHIWLARLCWLFASVGTLLIVIPMSLMTLQAYSEVRKSEGLINDLAALGTVLCLLSFATFILVVIEALVKKRPVPHKPAHKTEDVFE